jgi:putative NADH-flavin reductase
MSGCDLLVFGASKNTGLLVATLAAKRGEKVAAMVRAGSDASVLESIGTSIIRGDAFSLDDCFRAIETSIPRRVISLMGGKNQNGRRICAIGNIHVTDALLSYRTLEHFLLVTSMGCGEQYAGTSEKVKQFLGEALRAKTRAEDYLKSTTLPWTIVRPGGLTNEPATGQYFLSENPDRIHKGYLSRGDVAQAIVDVLNDPQWLNKAVSVQNAEKGE